MRELLDQVGRDAPRLVEVAPGDADEVRVELRPGRRRLEQLADPVVDEALVREPLDRRALLRAPLGRRRRHDDLLIPGQELAQALEVGDLRQAAAELVQVV